MAGYVQPGKEVQQQTREFPTPKHSERAAFNPPSTGSTNNYEQPWQGDAETEGKLGKQINQTLQSNIGNYLLYRQLGYLKDIEADVHPADQGGGAPGLGDPNGGRGRPGAPGLGSAPRPHGPSGGNGPMRELGPGTRELGPGPVVNQDQSSGALFSRDVFNGPVALPPAPGDRKPSAGNDARARRRLNKQRFQQGSLF